MAKSKMENNIDKKILHLQNLLDATRKLNRLFISSENSTSLLKESSEILVNTRGYLFAGITILDKDQCIIQSEWTGEDSCIEELHSGNLPSAYKKALQEDKLNLINKQPDSCKSNSNEGNWVTYILPFEIDNELQGILCAVILQKEAMHPKEKTAFYDIANNIGFTLAQIKQKALKHKSEMRYRKLVNSLSDALFILQDDKIKFANPMLCRLSGFSEDELIGADFTKFIAQDELEKIKNTYNKRAANKLAETQYQSTAVTKKGALIPVEVTVTKTDYNEQPAFQVILRDISDYKNALKQLQESKERFKFLSDSAFEGIIIHDKGIILDVNDSLLRLSGYSRDELIGENVLTKLISEEDRQKVIDSFKHNNNEFNLANLVTKEGKIRIAHIEARDIVYKGKQVRIAALRDITEKHQLEKQVKQTQQQLNRLLNNLPGVAYNCINDKNWAMNFMSRGSLELFGYQPEELVKGGTVKYYELIHPNDRSYVWDTIQNAVDNHIPFELEYRVITKTSEEKWVWERGNAIKHNKEILLEGFISDVTKIKQYETDLIAKNQQLKEEKNKAKEEQQKYQELFSNSASTMLLIDPESGAIVDANNAACNFYKYTYEQITSLNIDKINTFPLEVIKQQISRAINNLQNIFEFKHRLADGTTRDVESHSGSVVFGNRRLVYSIIHDISSKKAMARTNQMLSKAMESSPVSIVITDHSGKIEYVNPFFEEKTGYKREEAIGQNPRILKTGDQPNSFYEDLWTTISSGKTWHGEFNNKKKNGEHYWEHASISPIFDRQKEIIQYIAVKEDITQKRKTLQDLQEAKEKAEVSDKLKSSFLANMSHEIRTPMNGILGFTELLREPNLTGGQQKEFIEIIHSSGERMLSTINDIIDISKIESGLVEVNLQDINLSSLVNSTYAFFQPLLNKKGINFKVNENNGNPTALFHTDPDKLNSILNNLIRNAYKFTSSGSIEFGYLTDTNKITFFVSDTGVGIPKDRHKAIFERFVQADIADSRVFEGSGLGLSITKSYTEMLNGSIKFESEVGKGTTFYISIPLASTQEEQPTTFADQPKIEFNPSSKKLKVLIAEDDLVSVELLKLLISDLADEILVANNGIEALETARSHKDIDLILMDIKMPKMDGFTATQEIRKFNSEVKIVAQTAFAHSEDNLKAHKIGCNDFITKPINKQKMQQSIKNLFDN